MTLFDMLFFRRRTARRIREAVEESAVIMAMDAYADARAGLGAVCDGPDDVRLVRYRAARRELCFALRRLTK